MSAISIETKKVTELTAFTTPTDSCLIPIHDGTGLKKITFANFRAKAVEGTEAKIAPLLFSNAGAHNAIYRGKSLGSTVTTAQYAAIKAGTFDDLYIGDYWTIGGVNYRIAAFDYYLNSGDTNCTTHHVVIVPDTCLYNAQMHNTSSGGWETHSIDRITPHCVVGQLSAESICGCFISTSRQASCNYGIGTDGRISMSVEEKNRSWCSSSRENDQRAVTIECASDKTAPYAFNDAVYASLVNLCVDICQRNGKSKLLWLGDKNKTLAYAPKSDEMVLTVHRWFANKSCPGNWLYNRLGNLAAEVTKRLTGGSTDTGKVDVPSDGKTLYRVQTGAFSKRSNADAWAAKLKAAGFDTYIVQMGNLYKVQVGAYSQKSNAENMMAKLKTAGYDAFITTKSGTAAGTAKKSAAEIAKEIYNGTCSDARWSSWGNGADRVNRLKQAGYDPSEVQSEVNKLF